MTFAIQCALLEFNRAQAAHKPWFRYAQLTPEDKAVVDARANEIFGEMVLTLCGS